MKLKKSIVQSIKAITDVTELRCYLQNAVELEHATIPTYLTALLSIKQGENKQASQIIRSVVIEEMLHMSIACNVLNAIGGSPAINTKAFVPTFPGPLPMGVGEDRGLIVTLAPLSKDQLLNVFMAIEEPDDLLTCPELANIIAEELDIYTTIGEFYQAIIDKIIELGDDIFTGDRARQMVNHRWFPENVLWAVTNVETAVAALELIVLQGEGSGCSPLDPENQLAHYYRFAEIYHGRRLVKDPSADMGWSYTGEPIPLNEAGIYNLIENAKAADYEPDSVGRRYADQTNYTYSSLLNNLHQTFNGKPELIDQAMGVMYEFRLSVQKMVTLKLKCGSHAAPPFQYVALNR
ncbi:MAG: hypothetical protein ACI9FJ_000158 [Alteromonadaceae bacterium]|jgi:hypothetical protein